MKWKEFHTFIPAVLSRVNVNLKKNHDYYLSNNKNYARVLDSEGNIVRNGGGTFFTGDETNFTVEATDIDYIQINYGKEPMPFAQPSNEYRPAMIHVDVPTNAIARTALTLQQFGQLVNSITGVGIGAEVLLEGTFSYSPENNIPEASLEGFADDGQNIGGTLGYIYDPVNSRQLPL